MRPVSRFRTTTIATKPELRMSRSPKVASPTSPEISPSTNILPTGTAPAIDTRPPTRSTLTPLSATTMFSSGTPLRAASLALARSMRHVPCTGITLRGRTPVVEEQQLTGIGMARNVHPHLLIGDHPGTNLGQVVDDSVDRFFIAGGDQRRRQDDQVIGGDRDAAVLPPARHPGQRRHRLALRTGGDQHDLPGRHLLGHRDVDDVAVVDVQEAQLAGDGHIPQHRPADERNPPAQCDCGIDDLLHPVDVGGEARHDDPLPFGAAHEPVQIRANLAFRRPYAGDLGVGRVAQEQVHPGVAQPRHARQVGGGAAVERQLVELDVTGVQDGARTGVDGDRQRIGNRVVDREVLAFEHPRGCCAAPRRPRRTPGG